MKQIVSIIPKEVVSFNYDVFYGGESSGEEIVSAALTFPFGTSRRLVVVKSAELMTREDIEKIISYLDNPCENSLIILMAEIRDTQGPSFRELVRRGAETNFKPMYDREVVPWLRNRANTLGKRLTFRAAYELKEHVGMDLRQLANELEKLTAQVGERKEIEVEDVETSVGETRVRTGFEFLDAIGDKRETVALSILKSLLQQGKAGPEIIGLLAWQFRRIWRTKIYMERGVRSVDIAGVLRVPGFQVRRLVTQAGKFSHHKLEESFANLLETDIRTKSGGAPHLALELLVVRLCR